MKFQQPLYEIGTVVFLAQSSWQSVPIECPDCKGQKTWEVSTPAGEKFSTYCRTCWHGYDGCFGTVNEYGYRASTRRLTIGMVCTRQSEAKAEIQYMCEESGVGSGSMWNESELFFSEEVAKRHAQRQVEESQRIKCQETDQEKKAQRAKDMLIMEDSPRKKLEEERDYLKQQLSELKRKHAKPRKKALTKPSSSL